MMVEAATGQVSAFTRRSTAYITELSDLFRQLLEEPRHSLSASVVWILTPTCAIVVEEWLRVLSPCILLVVT